MVCSTALADRPAAVDHSTSQYFPPVGGPQNMGDCTCWSSCYYYSTYMQARDKGLDASTGDPDVCLSRHFLFPLIAQGTSGAECTEFAMSRLSDVGCAPISLSPVDEWYTTWPTEAAWVAALENRMGPMHAIRADTEAGLEEVKQVIADGSCVVTRALFHSNYWYYCSSASGVGISNRVLYMNDGYNFLRHSICICGYDDNKSYVDSRDGQTHHGAFLVVNSDGPDSGWYNSTGTGTKGFIWVAYSLFREGEFGLYDNDDSSYTDRCWDNPDYPTVYYHEDRPDYRPKLYSLAGLAHASRNLLTLTGGVGPTDAPEFNGPQAIGYAPEGDIRITATNRVAVDLTDGVSAIPPGATKNVFIAVTLDASASSSAGVSNVDFRTDFDGDGVYTTVSAVIPGRLLEVAPGTTEYVSVSVTNDAFVTGDLNCDGVVNAFDIDPFVAALVNPTDYAAQFPNCSAMAADCNGDGVVNAFDIDAFVACLVGGEAQD